MPEHPCNNRNNNDLAGTAAILANRPRHIHLVVDWIFGSKDFVPSLRPNTVTVIGHSLGGYTALAVAGGRPIAFPHETPDRQPHPVKVMSDHRVAALVLLAPATPWFMADGALNDVSVPILMLTADKDEHTPRWQSQIVTSGVPDRALVDHRIIPNAGHFSFTSPFPVAMIDPALPPSQDPEGFDRPRFHEHMNDEVLAFLRRVT
jgi:predicted dienelactone hydrolase